MQWVGIILAVVGVALLWFGYRATNEPGQPADVRMGGAIPMLLGIVLLVADAVIMLIWAVVK